MSSSAVTKIAKKVEKKIAKDLQPKGVSNPRKRKRKSRRNATLGAKRPRIDNLVEQYIATLNDPFSHPGVRLGFGCLIPTGLATVYTHGQITVNGTDGTFCIGTIPWIRNTTNAQSLSATSNQAYATTQTYAYVAAANGPNCIATFNLGRVVSGGIRAFARFPATSQAGVMYTSTNPSNNSTLLNSSAQTFQTYPQTQMCSGHSAAVLYRPTDTDDYQFKGLVGTATDTSLSSFQGFIFGTGYPVGSIIYYETAYHLECYGTTDTSAVDATGQDYLSNSFASVEQSHRTIAPRLVSAQQDLNGEFAYSQLVGRAAQVGAAAALGRMAGGFRNAMNNEGR